MPALVNDIIFRIGQSGSAASVAKWAAVGVAIAAVGKKMMDLAKESQRFDQLVSNLKINMDGFGKATANLIDTVASYEAANKLTAAGIEVTAKQMEAMGKAAVSLAQKTGTDATQQFNKLTKSVVMGTERGLVPYGIQLDETEDKSKAAAEAIAKLTDKFSDVSVEVQNANERMYALQNTLGTIELQLGSAAMQNLAFGFSEMAVGAEDAQSAIDGISESLSDNEGDLARYVTSWEGIKNQFQDFVASAVGAEETIAVIEDKRDKALIILRLEREIQEEINRQKNEQLELEGKITDEKEDQYIFTVKEIEAETKKQEREKKAKQAKARQWAANKKREEEAELKDLLSGTDRRVDIGFGSLNLVDEWDKQEKIDAENKAAEAAAKAEETRLAKEQALIEAGVKEIEIAEDKAKRIQEINDAMLEHEKHVQEERIRAIENMGSEVSLNLDKFASIQDESTKKGFKKAKAARTAKATMELPGNVYDAYQRGMEIPVVGWALAPIFAAAAGAFGAIQIAKTSSATFDGGGAATGSSTTNNFNTTNIAGPTNINRPNGTGAIDRRQITIVMDRKNITDLVVEESIERAQANDRGLMVRT